MPNGLKVFLMEDHELPMIDVSMRFRTGSNYEPADKTGLAEPEPETLTDETLSLEGETAITAAVATLADQINNSAPMAGPGGGSDLARRSRRGRHHHDVLRVGLEVRRSDRSGPRQHHVGGAKGGAARHLR